MLNGRMEAVGTVEVINLLDLKMFLLSVCSFLMVVCR